MDGWGDEDGWGVGCEWMGCGWGVRVWVGCEGMVRGWGG